MVALRRLLPLAFLSLSWASVASAQTVTQMPAATLPLTGQESVLVIQNGLARKAGVADVAAVFPPGLAMYPDASNATLPTARLNILPAPGAIGNILSSNGTDWTAQPAPATGGMDTSASNAVLPTARDNLIYTPASCDGAHYGSGNITAGLAVFTSSQANFTTADIGKKIAIEGAGVAGATLATTIASINTPTSANLTAAASTTVVQVGYAYGTDYTAQIQAELTAGRPIHLPKGECGISSTLVASSDNAVIKGFGAGSYFPPESSLLWLSSSTTPIFTVANSNNSRIRANFSGFSVFGMCAATKGFDIKALQSSMWSDIDVLNVTDAGFVFDISSDGNQDSGSLTLKRLAAGVQSTCASNMRGIVIQPGNDFHDFTRSSFIDTHILTMNGTGMDLYGINSTVLWNTRLLTSGTGKAIEFHSAASSPKHAHGTAWFGLEAQGQVVSYSGVVPAQDNYIYALDVSTFPLNVSTQAGATLYCIASIQGGNAQYCSSWKLFTDSLKLDNSAGTAIIFGSTATSGVILSGGTSSGQGANIELYGQSNTAANQAFYDAAKHVFRNQSGSTASLVIDPGATKATLSGNLEINRTISRDVTNDGMILYGGTSGDGANIELYGSTSGSPSIAFYDATTHVFRDQPGTTSRATISSAGFKADTITAITPSSASHTIANDGTNTDINAPSGNMDLRVGNTTILRATSAGASMQVGTLTGLAAPSAASDAATKAYADAIASGIVTHASVVAATTANLNATHAGTGVGATLTNAGAQSAFSTDGVSPAINDRVLVKDQTTTQYNGIYTLTTVGTGSTNWVLTRATDFDQAGATEVSAGASTIVVSGTTNGRTQWVETGQGPFTVDTTPIIFSGVTSAASGVVSAGTTSQLGYYAANGTTISGLTTGNNGVLVTNGSGVPAISSILPNATQDNITRLGTIATGVWSSSTKIGLVSGGTNADLSATGGTSNVLKQVTLGGNVSVGQLAYTDISGTLPNPAVGTKGGVEAITAVTSNWIRSINTSGVPQLSQPTCADISGAGTGCSTTAGTAASQNTGTSGANLPFLNGTNTWSGVQSFNSGDLALKGATSGTITLNAAGTAGANTITLPAGTTDFSATGGANQVVQQASAGGALTVGQLGFSNLSGTATAAQLPTFAHTQSTVAAPTGTASTTGVMMGLAGTITPTASGKVRFAVCGTINNNTASDGANVQLRTGTGAAPGNAAALTGTTRGSLVKTLGATAGAKSRACLIWTVTGLALSTAIWIDVGLAAVTGGTATFIDVDIVADEIP